MWTWIVKIALWALSGVAASKLMNSPKPNGWLVNILLGMIGGAVGSVLCKIIGIDAYHGIWNILVSIGGACIVIWLVRQFAK